MSDLEFSTNDGSVLSFTVTRRQQDEIEFDVAVTARSFSGVAPASTFVTGSPAVLFNDMASSWDGWKDQKKWNDLEGRVEFSATSDLTGHIELAVTLRGQDFDTNLHVVLNFEAGQLNGMAKAVSLLLGDR